MDQEERLLLSSSFGTAAVAYAEHRPDYATATAHLPTSPAAARFGFAEQAEFPHAQRRTADSLVATLATRAGMLGLPEQEREDRLHRIRDYLASRPETAEGEFGLPMKTCLLRVRQL